MHARVLLTLIAGVILSTTTGCQPNCRDLVFPRPADSPYVLPYPAGKSYVVSQSYCNSRGGHRNRIALDFMMPMGAQITASRGGEVIAVKENFEDGDLQRGHNNRVLIRHDDGTVAWYAHLQQDSVVVDVGQTVAPGQPIANCGNTGNTGNLPHLHFEVFRQRAFDYSDAIPVSFSNADGPVDSIGGLVAEKAYRALASRNR